MTVVPIGPHEWPKGCENTMLNGRTALIVEEEFLIALDIQRMLETLGVGQTLFARSAAEADELRASWPEIALAVVEIHRDTATTLDLVHGLGAAGIPIVLVTADVVLRKGFAPALGLPLVTKPVPEETLTEAVRQALAARS